MEPDRNAFKSGKYISQPQFYNYLQKDFFGIVGVFEIYARNGPSCLSVKANPMGVFCQEFRPFGRIDDQDESLSLCQSR